MTVGGPIMSSKDSDVTIHSLIVLKNNRPKLRSRYRTVRKDRSETNLRDTSRDVFFSFEKDMFITQFNNN